MVAGKAGGFYHRPGGLGPVARSGQPHARWAQRRKVGFSTGSSTRCGSSTRRLSTVNKRSRGSSSDRRSWVRASPSALV